MCLLTSTVPPRARGFGAGDAFELNTHAQPPSLPVAPRCAGDGADARPAVCDAAVRVGSKRGHEGAMASLCDLAIFLPDMAKSADREGKPRDIDGKFMILGIQAIDHMLKSSHVIISVRAFGLTLFRPAENVEGCAPK